MRSNTISQLAQATWRMTRALGQNRRGNVAIVFALLAIPMIGAIGLAVDFARVLSFRATAQGAADSAALFAVKTIKESTTADKKGTNAAALIADAESQAKKLFDASIANLAEGEIDADVTVRRVGAKFLATVTYDVEMQTTFSLVLGQETMRASGTVETFSTMPLFTDVSLLLDISQSMGLAATEAGAKQLFSATKAAGGKGCVFGCHASAPSFGTATPFSDIATKNGIQMRIDVLRDAVKNMVMEGKAIAGDNGQYRFALYTMSYSFSTLAALSDYLTGVQAKASAINLGYNDSSGFGDTDYKANLPKLLPYIINKGDGLSQAKARQFVFIVTDGVKDVKGNSCTSGHCTGPIDPTDCEPFKTRGATVGVIYTTFLPVLNDPYVPNGPLEGNYKSLVQPFASQIRPKLQACASPGWFFEASDAAGIHVAMEAMFRQIQSPPTVTR